MDYLTANTTPLSATALSSYVTIPTQQATQWTTAVIEVFRHQIDVWRAWWEADPAIFLRYM